ncbi:MAG: hypothetical protein ACRDYW_00325 [Acidimicrobiales bacterium]
MALAERTGRRSSQADALAVFAVMWALAAVWHLLGNTTTAPGWAQAALALGAGLVLLQPGAPLPLAALALGGLLTVWEEAPFVGNHWVLAGMIDLAILVAVGVGFLRRRVQDRADLAARLLPAARLCLLGFYFFAAFAKLNSAFFDRTVSCAAFFFRESTGSVGLDGLGDGGPAWVDHAVIWGTALTELSIPVLLLFRRTRHLGVMVALVFHTVLAIDRSHEFFDFSSVLLALFVLFLPPTVGTWMAERVGSVRARLSLRHEELPARALLALVAAPVAAGCLVAVDVITAERGIDVGWWPWQAYAIGVIATAVTFLRQHRIPGAGMLRPHHALFALVPLLVVANGLTPYLEVKTGYGWNMYANLRTVDGESNHLVVRRTFPLTDEQSDLVEIVSSSSPVLARYGANGYGLTWRQLRRYVAEHPDIRITYRRGNVTVSLQRASDRPELVEPVPEWREKLQLFRAIDLREPERCLSGFGAAR